MQVKKHSEYFALFENIARQHKSVKHTTNDVKFFENFELYQTSGGVKGKHIVIGWAQSRFIDKNSDNVFRPVTLALWILEQCPVNSKIDQQRIFNETEQIAIDIISYLRKHVEDVNSTRIVNHFPSDGIILEPMGPVSNDNCFGTQLQLVLGNPEHLDFDESKWDLN